jgi:hypothetical protein
MAYSPEQQKIINAIKAIAAKRGAGPKVTKAALETGAVESNFRNLPGGDADSAGWRQERGSLYKNPTNLNASINRFIDEALAKRQQYGSAGALAAAVQRPAAQYRGRYQQHSAEADALLGRQNPSAGATDLSTGGSRTTTTETTMDQAGYDKARKLAILGNYLQQRDPNNALLKLGVATPGALPDPANFKQTKLTQHVTSQGYSPTTAGLLQTLTERANKIDAKKLPYAWGGGHGAKPVKPGSNIPVDCSGAVSAVLGVNPRVSGEFAKWGKPGKGRVTVYANKDHVLMEINGHFFGTSASNPGGGAGWIPRSQISPQYLKGFTARHIDA